MGGLLAQSATPLSVTLMVIAAVVMLFVVLGFVTYAVLFERKVLGWAQARHGPIRVGPWGMFQTVADILKLLTKEDTIPERADKPLFRIAPIIAYAPAFAIIAVIPFTENIYFSDIGIGLLTGNFEGGAAIKLGHFDLWRRFPFGAFGDRHVNRRDLVPVAMAQAARAGFVDAGPHDVIVVGDTPYDVDCAVAHGARAIGVATGPFTTSQLAAAGAHLVVETLADAIEVDRWIDRY